jgi:2'-5' RNA ligase
MIMQQPIILGTHNVLQSYSGSRGLYARVYTYEEDPVFQTIQTALDRNGIRPSSVIKHGLHITLTYSPAIVLDAVKLGRILADMRVDDDSVYEYSMIEASYWKGNSGLGYIVIAVDSPELVLLHSRFAVNGISHTYTKFTPHVTVAKEVGPIDFNIIRAIDSINSVLRNGDNLEACLYANNLTCSDI